MESGRNSQTLICQLLKEAGDDFGELLYIIGKFDLRKRGTKLPESVHEAKTLIQSILDASGGETSEIIQDLDRRFELLKRNLQENRKVELQCKNFFQRTAEVLKSDNTSKFLKCQIYQYIPELDHILKKRSTSLESAGVRILVTGEICAGKSSLLNVLMEGNYLPVDHGPCTRVSCEVQISPYRQAFIHYTERFKWDPTKLDLTENVDDTAWQRVRECIILGFDRYKDDETISRKDVESVIIFWPVLHTCYQEYSGIRVTFVDSPGFGDNADDFSYLQPRMETCDAYIVVINNANHHGVESDRVHRIMNMLKQNMEDGNTIFNPSCAFFFCNKWDLVPSARAESLKADVLRRLQNEWPSITKQQVLTISATQALEDMSQGNISKGYCDFMHHICSIVEKAIHFKLETHSWWLMNVLEKTYALEKNSKELQNSPRKLKQEITYQLRCLEQILLELDEKREQAQQILKDLEMTAIKNLKHTIKICIETNKSALSQWSEDQLPVREQGERWYVYQKELNEEIIERITCTIISDNDVTGIYEDYVKSARETLEKLVKEQMNVEPKVSILGPMHGDHDIDHDRLEQVFRGVRTTIIMMGFWLFLPLVPFALFIHDKFYLQDQLDNEELFNSDHVNYMKRQTHIILSNAKRNLQSIASARLQNVPHNAQRMIECIGSSVFNRLQSLQELAKVISYEKYDPSGDNNCFKKITDDCTEFYLSNVMRHEIDNEKLEIYRESLIGSGGFGMVVKGQLEQDGNVVPIAVKINRQFRIGALPDDTSIFRECFLMRQLMNKVKSSEEGSFPHIVSYFGSTYSITEHVYELFLIMELCDTDLGKQIASGSLIPSNDHANRILFPGTNRPENHAILTQSVDLNELSVPYAMDIALQAAKGLLFVHENGIIHRDVKASNFLIKIHEQNIIVKISDVGVSREQSKIKTIGGDVGTKLYHAPEILVNPLNIHTYASDVYSFGLLLWEIWYGQRVYNVLRDGKTIPEWKEVHPSRALKELMDKCRHRTPNNRPKMPTVVDGLTQLVKGYQK